MHPSFYRLFVGFASAQAAALSTGCVSSKYQFQDQPRRAALLDLRASASPALGDSAPAASPGLEAVLHSVIVLQGPGSWKKHAYWDEYVLLLTNRSDAPVTIERATLTDFQSQTVTPGTDPWMLEKQSREFERRMAQTAGDVLKIGSGVVMAGGAGIAAGATAAWVAGASGFTAIGIAGIGMVAAVPAYAVGTVYRNVSGKTKIETEFATRSLKLPLTLAPEKLMEGSLFFRVSPGPRQLVLSTRAAGGEARDVVIDLTSLAGLHFKTAIPNALRANPAAAGLNAER